jgi:hypothetical protein
MCMYQSARARVCVCVCVCVSQYSVLNRIDSSMQPNILIGEEAAILRTLQMSWPTVS